MGMFKIIVLLLLIPALLIGQKKEETKFQKASKYFFQKKFEMAELLLREELKDNPENRKAYSYLGDIMLQKGQYDAAIELYKKAVDLDPSSAEEEFRLGQAYYAKKLGNVAVDHYKKALQKNPNLKYAYFHLGLSNLMLLRDKSETIRNWEEYLRAAPEDPQYEKIRRAIELLKDPNFKIPPPDSDIPIEEILHLGGDILKTTEKKDSSESAGHEDKKTVKQLEDIYRDDDLN